MKTIIYLNLILLLTLFLNLKSNAQNNKVKKCDSSTTKNNIPPSCIKSCRFIDKNHDSVCDNYSTCRKPGRNNSADKGCKNNPKCCKRKTNP